MHICIIKHTIIRSDNGSAPSQCQAIIWTKAGILLIWPMGTNFNEILMEIYTFSFKKMLLKMLSGKCQPFCVSLNVLIIPQASTIDHQSLMPDSELWAFFCDFKVSTIVSSATAILRADSKFAPSQWETALLCNGISYWLGANLESVLPSVYTATLINVLKYTTHPMKYTCLFCCVLLWLYYSSLWVQGIYSPIFLRVSSLALGQSYDSPWCQWRNWTITKDNKVQIMSTIFGCVLIPTWFIYAGSFLIYYFSH